MHLHVPAAEPDAEHAPALFAAGGSPCSSFHGLGGSASALSLAAYSPATSDGSDISATAVESTTLAAITDAGLFAANNLHLLSEADPLGSNAATSDTFRRADAPPIDAGHSGHGNDESMPSLTCIARRIAPGIKCGSFGEQRPPWHYGHMPRLGRRWHLGYASHGCCPDVMVRRGC